MSQLTSREFLMNLWRRSAGYAEAQTDVPPYTVLLASEWDIEVEQWIREHGFQRRLDEFIKLMRNRLIMGRFRYGPLNGEKPNWDRIGRIRAESKLWRKDKISERCVDIANMYFLEYVENGRDRLHLALIVYWHKCWVYFSVPGESDNLKTKEIL